MNSLDKKIISFILVVFMIYIPFAKIVNANENGNDTLTTFATDNSNPALKTNTEKAELYWDHVLTASGDLYEIDYSNPTSNMKKVDSNVSKYIYQTYPTASYLKGNTVNFIHVDYKGNKTTASVQNVKDIGVLNGKGVYLTTSNEVYCINSINNSKVETKLVDTGVSNLISSACYYKDGKTYSLYGYEVYNGKVDEAFMFLGRTYYRVGNTLYRFAGYSSQSYKVTDNFARFNYNNYQLPVSTIQKDGSVAKNSVNFAEEMCNNEYHLGDNNLVSFDGNAVMSNVKLVSKVVINGKNYYYFLRTDGSVWVNTGVGTNTKCVLDNTKKVPFADVTSNDWYYEAVKYAYENNIIKGYDNGTFAPNDQLTRGMLATILYRMEGEQKVTGTPKFPDVQDSSKFYYKAVKWATDNNIVAGYNNGNFGPEDNITREQLAVILNRYASYKKKDVTKTNDLSKFSDTASISDYAVNSLKWAVGSGVVTGNADGTLNPRGNATRAEVAAMMEKYCKNVGR